MSASLVQDIGGLIESWQPRKTYHIGPSYLDDLKKYLQDRMAAPASFFGRRPTIEFSDGKGMDIGVRRKTGAASEAVGIVMKRDLATLADLKVLMEQVVLAGKNYSEVFLILMGTSTADMETKLGSFLANRGGGPKVTIIKK
ncbi:MAG TPA: hypothetical protein VLV30_04400 [Methanomicrobiales archaeon]|nr:hypothetical protein [Methanomicrobiales archaeon]